MLGLLVAIALLAAIGVAIARTSYPDEPFGPDSPAATGSQALLRVLQQDGVDVRTVRWTRDAADDLRAGRTVVLTDSSDLEWQQLELLAQASAAGEGRLVLIAPDPAALEQLLPGTTIAGDLPSGTGTLVADARCGEASFRARTVRAGDVALADASGTVLPGTLYAPGADAEACFRTAHGASIVRADGPGSGDVVVLGSPAYVMNGGISAADDSAVAINAIGAAGEVSWYLPSASDPMLTGTPSPLAHLPRWLLPLLGWGVLCAVLALIALAWRLGPVVLEPLPVTVRSQELTVGRANLLQRAGAHDRAARSLRAAAAGRLADHLGVRRTEDLDVLIAALAPHTTATPAELRALLGPVRVRSDEQLVRLARDLDRLQEEIDR